jgi:hypothetical protein
MNITLSWDLFVIVFFSVIIAYSFIVGRNATLKIIIGTYIATLTADGLANLVRQYISPNVPLLSGPDSEQIYIVMKIVVFIIAVVVIAVKGGFEVNILMERQAVVRILSTFVFGALNAGLIVSTLLIYVSGFSLIGMQDAAVSVAGLGSESLLVQMMIDNYSLWFSLPAIALVVVSFAEPTEI